MPVHNADIAAIFDEIADLLDIRGDNPFRIRAYRKAARTVAGFGHEFTSLFEAGSTPPKLPGIGVDLAAKIREIATTGHCAMLDNLRKEVPPAITELLKIPGLGPRRVQTLHSELGISSIAQLRQAAQSGQLRQIAGFGPKTEQGILKALQLRAGQSAPPARFLRAVAGQYALSLLEYLKAEPGIAQLIVAGSYRRQRETVGDLDILATAANTSQLMQRLLAYDEVQTVLAHGETRSSVVLRNGLQVDLRLVQPECYGAALHYFTGSKAHNIAMRHLARARGLKLNEYGVFRASRRIAGDTEASVFAAVGLPYIVPELREDRGEIEAARNGRLPQLINRSDLRGDLHAHSTASDGKHSIEQMAAAAQALGLEYMAITDHSQRLTVARGLNPAQLERQIEQIDRLNRINQFNRINAESASGSGLTILKGSEVDILEDGTLDLPDQILQRLDLVVVAVHSKFNLPRQRQTERILKALEHPYVDLLAHPGGRLLGQRDPIAIDFPAVLRKAKSRQIFLELNSQPDRLDLDELCCKMARDEGVLISINSDAHSNAEFANLDYGIAQARRGWLSPADVLNTRSLAELRSLLKSGRAARTG